MVSLDRFKKVSDTLGHAAGDIVLGEAAARLQSCIGEADTVARFDGEEFAMLLTQIEEAGDLSEVSLAVREASLSRLPSVVIFAQHLAVRGVGLSALVPRFDMVAFHFVELEVLIALHANDVLPLVCFPLHAGENARIFRCRSMPSSTYG